MYLTWFEGQWHEGNAPLMGAADHAVWLGSSVFDGARAIHGCVPDLDLHLQRVIDSSRRLGLECP
ncbi:MAG: branched chain amino acid aminotransferase, partial [Betaproteobacteria bacterium]|nr:branched chain amino acid aminotransferase [Betaproteobacteria bacterium]